MKSSIPSNFRPPLRACYVFLIAIAVLSAMPKNANAQVYVLQINPASGTVSKYSTEGDLINANFITGLNGPIGLVLSGDVLFVGNAGSVGKYDATTGGAINASFIPGLMSYALALSNNSLFVAYDGSEHGYTVGEYDATTGAAINANLITGQNEIFGLAVSDNKLFVCTGTEEKGRFVFTVGKYDVTTGAAISANFIKGLNLLAAKGNTLYGLVGVPPHQNTVGKYDAINGTAISPRLVTGLKAPSALAVSDNKIFVAEYLRDTVGEYNATTGAVINPRFITGTMMYPIGIAIKSAK
jgi:hypothetical protein